MQIHYTGAVGPAERMGIVESCAGSYVYTIEGNANDAVKRLSYPVNYRGITGYGVFRHKLAAR